MFHIYLCFIVCQLYCCQTWFQWWGLNREGKKYCSYLAIHLLCRMCSWTLWSDFLNTFQKKGHWNMIKRICIVGRCQTKEPGGILGYTITSCKNSSKPLLLRLTFFLSPSNAFLTRKKPSKTKSRNIMNVNFAPKLGFQMTLHLISLLKTIFSVFSPHHCLSSQAYNHERK